MADPIATGTYNVNRIWKGTTQVMDRLNTPKSPNGSKDQLWKVVSGKLQCVGTNTYLGGSLNGPANLTSQSVALNIEYEMYGSGWYLRTSFPTPQRNIKCYLKWQAGGFRWIEYSTSNRPDVFTFEKLIVVNSIPGSPTTDYFSTACGYTGGSIPAQWKNCVNFLYKTLFAKNSVDNNQAYGNLFAAVYTSGYPGKIHPGIDLYTGSGTSQEVYAPCDGTIATTGLGGTHGVVPIRMSNGWNCLLGHFSKINDNIVAKKPIEKGEPLGKMGAKGLTSGGAHVHVEISSITSLAKIPDKSGQSIPNVRAPYSYFG